MKFIPAANWGDEGVGRWVCAKGRDPRGEERALSQPPLRRSLLFHHHHLAPMGAPAAFLLLGCSAPEPPVRGTPHPTPTPVSCVGACVSIPITSPKWVLPGEGTLGHWREPGRGMEGLGVGG